MYLNFLRLQTVFVKVNFTNNHGLWTGSAMQLSICRESSMFLFLFIIYYSRNNNLLFTEQRDEIGVAVQSWLWERVELMAW